MVSVLLAVYILCKSCLTCERHELWIKKYVS